MTDMEGSTKAPASAFKQAQARYRKQALSPDLLAELVDFSRGRDDRIISITVPKPEDSRLQYYEGKVSGLRDHPGFLYAPQALSDALQIRLAYAAVTEYCEKPHVTNMDAVPPKPSEELNTPEESMWSLWKQENFNKTSETIQATVTAPTTMNEKKKKYRNFRKLSWATMGYHYDWTMRAYHEDAKSPMPALLKRVTQLFATTSFLVNGATSLAYTPSACIVNYYTSKSTMGGHRDDLELALDKPIISLSLGLPAVFLLGGLTVESTPITPILVRPGDVLVLGGDCRLCYHSMARLLPADTLPVDASRIAVSSEQVPILGGDEAGRTAISGISKEEEEAVKSFLCQHRININVRQVYPDSED